MLPLYPQAFSLPSLISQTFWRFWGVASYYFINSFSAEINWSPFQLLGLAQQWEGLATEPGQQQVGWVRSFPWELASCLHDFARAARAKDHKLRGLTQHPFAVSQLRHPDVWLDVADLSAQGLTRR